MKNQGSDQRPAKAFFSVIALIAAVQSFAFTPVCGNLSGTLRYYPAGSGTVFVGKSLPNSAELNFNAIGYNKENLVVPQFSPPPGICFPGTGNRFTGSWHSNLYIGNNNGNNVLLAWGQLMKDYTGTGSGDITTPAIVSSASYTGIPLEVRSCSSGGPGGESVMVMRSTSGLYVFGSAANLSAITSYSRFGGTAINMASSDVTTKLPAGVLVTDIVQVAVSQTALAIVTTTGHVYILTRVADLQGNKAAADPSVWHHVTLNNGTSFLTGITKLSLSSSGALALAGSTNKVYYWGAPANTAGTVNTTTSYNYACDISTQIPVGVTIKDLECLGTKAPGTSTLFLLGSNGKVYASGRNAGGVLGINNPDLGFNQATFLPVKGTDGITDLSNIVKIDGNTEGDIFCMAAINTAGQIFGWGDSPAGMLGVNASTASYPVPKTVQLFLGTAPGTGYVGFSVAGQFIIAFYINGGVDQYWYLGRNTGGSMGDPSNTTQFVLADAPASLNPTIDISYNCSNLALPINWLSFNAQKKENTVLLNWSTAREINSRDYLVQHSIDAINWSVLGTRPAAGNSNSTKFYSFVHPNPIKGINYYRLHQRDIDGNSSYSKTISILISNKTDQLIIAPNMVVNGELSIQLPEAAGISIFSTAGELVISRQMAAGRHIINTTKLAKGMYLLKSGVQSEKFIIK